MFLFIDPTFFEHEVKVLGGREETELANVSKK